MKKIIYTIFALIFSCIICSKASGESTNEFTINKPAIKIIQELKTNSDDVNFTIPKDTVKILELVDTEIGINLFLKPKQHYYVLTIDLLKPANKVIGFHKELQIWAKPNQTIFKSSVNISYGRNFCFPLRWINCIKEKIILDIERKILDFEERKFREISE